MKNLTSIFVLALSGLLLFGCRSDDDHFYVDYDTYPVAYDLNNKNFDLVDGVFQLYGTFNDPLMGRDMLLMYMKTGTTNGSPIWQQIPITFYLEDGHEVDYNFDFSKYDFVIYAGGTFDLSGTEFVKNQTFRILVIPADPGNRPAVDLSDYNAVLDYFGIQDSDHIEL